MPRSDREGPLRQPRGLVAGLEEGQDRVQRLPGRHAAGPACDGGWE